MQCLYFQYIQQPTNLAQLINRFAELGPDQPQLVLHIPVATKHTIPRVYRMPQNLKIRALGPSIISETMQVGI